MIVSVMSSTFMFDGVTTDNGAAVMAILRVTATTC